jgi:hypothetical protein
VAFSRIMVPMMNFYFYYPENLRVMNAGADVLQIILEGDEQAEGLRFAGQPCAIPTGGSSHITAATATTLTYNYIKADSCGTGGTASTSVALTYVPGAGNQIVTRSINAGPAVEIPSYATNASGIEINPPSATNFFRYYDSAGTEMTGAGIVLANIYRVDITVNATSGTGFVHQSAGQILLKAGVEIKRYTT